MLRPLQILVFFNGVPRPELLGSPTELLVRGFLSLAWPRPPAAAQIRSSPSGFFVLGRFWCRIFVPRCRLFDPAPVFWPGPGRAQAGASNVGFSRAPEAWSISVADWWRVVVPKLHRRCPSWEHHSPPLSRIPPFTAARTAWDFPKPSSNSRTRARCPRGPRTGQNCCP